MSTITYIVKIASGKFTIDDAVAPKLTFRDGDTYIFDQSDGTNAGHILQFSATSNNSGSSEYTTGVTKTGTAGQAGAKTTIVTSSSTTDTLYYYSSGGGDHGREFSNTGFNTSANYNVLKPIVGSSSTAEKWGAMVNHAIDQIDLQAKDNRDYTDQHAFQGEPHIIPDVLYPAVAGKLLDGTTSHGATYGVAQSDGRMYYYTDIKGSKPIKDPRIGSHFGSQRHKFKSLQLLEQETATHGKNVYSVDGREWIRISEQTASTVAVANNAHGTKIDFNGNVAGTIIEITGYFNDANVATVTDTNRPSLKVSLNGTQGVASSSALGGVTTVGSPIDGRFLPCGSLMNIGDVLDPSFGSTPQIYTLTLEMIGGGHYGNIENIELIAQDTSSTANKSKIQIPAQNVVSYGKKFAIPATAQHYNPFATKGDGSASTIPNNTTGDSVATGWTGSTSAYWDSTLDTATSLGLGAWESGGNFYRPVNGGRIVKWVDSSGNIKTSVNMMPPEADSIAEDTGTCDATGTHNWSTQYLPQFGNKRVGSAITEDDMADNSTSGWTQQGDSLTFDTDHYEFTTSATNKAVYSSADFPALTAGRLYKISMQVKNGTASGIGTKLQVGSSGMASVLHDFSESSTTGSFVTRTHVFTALGTERRVGWKTSTNMSGNNIEIKNFTLYEIEDPSIQTEVAKTFHWREFGNGSANAPTGSWKDLSMLNTGDDRGYVMDDGLTSLSVKDVEVDGNLGFKQRANSKPDYLTFIGTGISWKIGISGSTGADEYDKWVDGVQIVDGDVSRTTGTDVIETLAQNLPYGTHILKFESTSSDAYKECYKEFTFHQPKMPPIPEDAVVIADYMLMADYVKTTDANNPSKGIRRINCSRDWFYDSSDSTAFTAHTTVSPDPTNSGSWGLKVGKQSAWWATIPYFGTQIGTTLEDNTDSGHGLLIDGSSVEGTKDSLNNASHGYTDMWIPTASVTLGVHTIKAEHRSGGYRWGGGEVASPIHTSSHYQSFETPFLHELVGGDRNMEQNNLVVTADGKTWDEVTRDVGYIGNTVVSLTSTTSDRDTSDLVILDECRGSANAQHLYNKDFAIAYDRLICLRDGNYIVTVPYLSHATGTASLWVNGTEVFRMNHDTSARSSFVSTFQHHFKRGDYLQIKGGYWVSTIFSHLYIHKT